MKSKKYGDVTSCCWGYRHELIGLVLLVLATILTLATGNSLGIFAMFIVGAALFCHRCWFWHCHKDAHCHTDTHCHSMDEECGTVHMDKEPKQVKKPRVKKTKA